MTTIERVKDLCNKKGIAISKLERELKYSNGSLAKALNVKDDRLGEIADYFGVSVDYLLGREESYYNDPIVADYTAELFNRPELKVLFEATRNASADDIKFVVEMIERMKNGTNKG